MELEQRQFYKQQINKFKELRPLYKKYCEILEKILSNVIKGRSSEYIIQSRIKKISSFANKLFDPDKNYINPFQEINDLCGIRIILPNINEMNAVCEIIKDIFYKSHLLYLEEHIYSISVQRIHKDIQPGMGWYLKCLKPVLLNIHLLLRTQAELLEEF